jgi:RNA polymerase sigma-70 factor (ECF subfamily)
MAAYHGHAALPECTATAVVLQAPVPIFELVCELMDSALERETKSADTSLAKDIEDVRRSRRGDPDAFRRLIERHQDRVGRILWKFSRDGRVHEELIQDAFVEAYLSLHTYRRKAPFGNWLSRIATRVGYRHWKRQARRKRQEAFSLSDWDRISGEQVERMEPGRAAELLHGLLEHLPPRDRLVLTLRYIEECDVAETASRTGWTKTMVKVQSLRARKKLKRLFEESRKDAEL